ncbi:conserved hypothetical protein [Desulfosarcina cetonica]|uniref:NifB/NifX family molybdenum-iron cluster-binding protein n=1 Tax=Desulfosarcina cetonica TaxID=90730 RepID=UPI0006D08AA2|nr:NifB/NifX family molybdenum-iron cluster-binding protein [Desulfosarcina cetonica]VTR64296.1 conserved hypothetical protein [Desulfosarcina cetonica]
MKVAITIWGDRISPVFDAARRLLIVTIDQGHIINREEATFDPEQPSNLTKALIDQEVAVLICGAVSQTPAAVITASGIRLIPFITGKVERVLGAYAQGTSLAPAFIMPGCLGAVFETDSSSTH